MPQWRIPPTGCCCASWALPDDSADLATQSTAAPTSREPPHPVSAATFVEYWGCPHRTIPGPPVDDPDPPAAAGERPRLLRHLRLFTLVADVQKHYQPDQATRQRVDLRRDIAAARSVLAGLLVPTARRELNIGRRRHFENVLIGAAPDGSRLSDLGALAAAVTGYLQDVHPEGSALRYTVRWRAIQLALLERGWYLAEDIPPPGGRSHAPVTRLTKTWTAAVNRLVDPVCAGYLALAYSTGLPAETLARIRPTDLHPSGELVAVDGHCWTVPSAAPFVRALRLAKRPLRVSAAGLRQRLVTGASLIGLPPPPAAATDGSASPTWWSTNACTLTSLPAVTVAAPDPVRFALEHLVVSDAGAPIEDDLWPHED